MTPVKDVVMFPVTTQITWRAASPLLHRRPYLLPRLRSPASACLRRLPDRRSAVCALHTINRDTIQDIVACGHSRLPVHMPEDRRKIVGVRWRPLFAEHRLRRDAFSSLRYCSNYC